MFELNITVIQFVFKYLGEVLVVLCHTGATSSNVIYTKNGDKTNTISTYISDEGHSVI